jgi:hypothetical protein
MSDPALNSAKSMSEPVLKPMTVSVDGLVADSATPLQGQRKGFPVMPGVHNMKPMSVRNVPVDTRCGPNKYRAANGPTVEDWEAVLVGRTFIFPEAVRLSARQSFSSDADWRREKGLWNAADAKLGLRSSVRQSKGAMGRLPPEVVRMIEQVLQDDEDRTVGFFRCHL